MFNEIQKAPREMRGMLLSVYNYNSQFLEDEEQRRLLGSIIEAMMVVDRKFFVSEDYYLDAALPIGEGQTISQPSTVARMLFLAELKKGDIVFEVGTGSGWNSALISFLVYPGKVVSIDRISGLVEKAKNNVKNLEEATGRKLKIKFSSENFFSDSGKYDKIIITAGMHDKQQEKIRKMAERLLKKGGILVSPRRYGKMIIFKNNRKLEKLETKEEYVFVPLVDEK
jgi:protein-L-isoaspartate(D-aspartate) O-methyltransferase